MLQPAHAQSGVIAVVEDDPDIREMLNLLLTEAGYRTLLLADRRAAQAAIRQDRPALVILDIWLDRAHSGWLLLRALQRDPVTRTIPVIVCSAHALLQPELRQFLSTPHYAFLPKPFQLEALLAQVQALTQPPRIIGGV